MTEKEYLARAGIKKTMAICAMAGDARKADIYADCFTEDGVLILDPPVKGRDGIRKWMAPPTGQDLRPETTASGSARGFVSHQLSTCRITFTSDTVANVKTYFFVITSIGPDHSGYYDDIFKKEGDVWLIASRHPHVVWVNPQSVMVPR